MSCESLRSTESTLTIMRYSPAWAGFTSTPKIPGRDGAGEENDSAPAGPSSLTSTLPAFIGLKLSSRVKWTANRAACPATRPGYSINSSVLPVQWLTLSPSGFSAVAGATFAASRLQEQIATAAAHTISTFFTATPLPQLHGPDRSVLLSPGLPV